MNKALQQQKLAYINLCFMSISSIKAYSRLKDLPNVCVGYLCVM